MPPGDTARQIPPEVLNSPNGPDLAQQFLTPGSYAYVAALSDYTPTPEPVVPSLFRQGYIFQEKYMRDLLRHHPGHVEVVVYPPATLGGL